jgi:hypothetical protein
MGDALADFYKNETAHDTEYGPVCGKFVDPKAGMRVVREDDKNNIVKHDNNEIDNEGYFQCFHIPSQCFNPFKRVHGKSLPISPTKNWGKRPSATEMSDARTMGTTMVSGASLMFSLFHSLLPWKNALIVMGAKYPALRSVLAIRTMIMGRL